MKWKWIIGIGLVLLGGVIIDGIIYWRRGRAKIAEDIYNQETMDKTVRKVKAKCDKISNDLDKLVDEAKKKQKDSEEFVKVVDKINDEIKRELGQDPKDILKNTKMQNGETSEEWLDRVFARLETEQMNRELNID